MKGLYLTMFIYCIINFINEIRIVIDHIQILLIGLKTKTQQYIPINKKGSKCFQYAVAVMLNHEEIKKDPESITKIKPFINI